MRPEWNQAASQRSPAFQDDDPSGGLSAALTISVVGGGAHLSRTTRTALALIACVLLIVGARTVFAFVRYGKIMRHSALVRTGDSRASVNAMLGKPNYYEGKRGVIHFPRNDCAVEYVYSHPFAPLFPVYYIVSFSGNNRVIQADWWQSP